MQQEELERELELALVLGQEQGQAPKLELEDQVWDPRGKLQDSVPKASSAIPSSITSVQSMNNIMLFFIFTIGEGM